MLQLISEKMAKYSAIHTVIHTNIFYFAKKK